MNRRHLLRATALALPVVALAACTTSSTNGVATVTIDSAAVDVRGSALIAAATAILAAPSILVVLGPENTAIAQTALAGMQAALTQFDAITKGSLALSVDTSKAQALVVSLLVDLRTILNLVQASVSKLQGPVVTSIGNYVAAILTLIPLVQLAASLPVPPQAARTHMTEAEALHIATH